MPALLTRISTRPNFASTCEKSASGADVPERSEANADAFPPALSMAATMSAVGPLPCAATVAPAWASAVAMAAPIPPAEPVTSAILLSRRKQSRMFVIWGQLYYRFAGRAKYASRSRHHQHQRRENYSSTQIVCLT